MTQDRARTRAVDENLFGKTQAQILARRRVVEEQDEIAAAREENTLRLRALRLEKEANMPPVIAGRRSAVKALPAPKGFGDPSPKRKTKAKAKAG